MMSEIDGVADITPANEPISLAKGMVERAPGAVAALAVLVKEDGTMWYDCCGHQRMHILWALQRMLFTIMEDEG